MSEFANEITERVAQASTSLSEATENGDDYLVDVRVGELEDLARIAADHDVEVPGLQETLEAHTGSLELPIDLREEQAAEPDPA
jgi:hypothetical protein